MTLGISDEEFENAIDEAARTRRVDLAHAKDFAVGPLRVIPSLRTISGPDGEAVLEPKVMQVLIALGYEAGAILSRDDLIDWCWEGRVVGESSINRVISLLRSGLKSVTGETVKVENVPKVGYRLLVSPEWEAPLEESEPEAASSSAAAPAAAPVQQRRWGSVVLAAGVAALLAIVTGAYAFWPAAAPAPVERLTIAMLPLKAGEGVDPLYARGLEAELRSQLARVGQMEVTSSDSARQLFEQGLSADEICRKLGADYAWVGALDIETDKVTLSANLIEAKTKQSAYRETLSSAPGAAQTLPLRSARAITTALGRPTSERVPELNVTAGDYSLYLTALGLIKGRGLEQREAAYQILKEVTQRNPDFADGWAGFAKATYLRPWPSSEMRTENWDEAETLAAKALSMDPDAVDALKVAGQLEEDPVKAVAALKRATELDPGDSEAWFWLSIIQRRAMLEGGSPLDASLRMVAVDPLWPASWRASDLAAEFGKLDFAFKVEDDILAAVATPSQRLLAQARVARLKGDLSGFVDLSSQAAGTQTEAERRYGSRLQLRMLRVLLGLPLGEGDVMGRESPDKLVAQVYAGQLPSLSQLAKQGMTAQRFWQSPTFGMPAMRLFLEQGREEDLLSLYDEAFGSVADYLAMADATGFRSELVPDVSPFLVVALRAAGRDQESQEHLKAIDGELRKWRKADTGWIRPVIWEIQYASLTNDKAAAIAGVRKLPDYGWPYAMGHIDTGVIGLLDGHPLYDGVENLAEVRAVLDPIRANLAKERREVLALGV